MFVVDIWDVLAIVGLFLIIIGAALIYWPLALILCGGLLLAAYCVRECRHVPQSPAPAPIPVKRDESE